MERSPGAVLSLADLTRQFIMIEKKEDGCAWRLSALTRVFDAESGRTGRGQAGNEAAGRR
jgi:hypothetical protein